MLEIGAVEIRCIGDSGSVSAQSSKELMRLGDSSGGTWRVWDVIGWLKSDFVEETGTIVYGGMVSGLLVSCKFCVSWSNRAGEWFVTGGEYEG